MFMYEPWAVSVCVCEGQGRVMGENIYSWDLQIQSEEGKGGMDGWMEDECVGEDEEGDGDWAGGGGREERSGGGGGGGGGGRAVKVYLI